MNTDLDTRIVPDREINDDDVRLLWTLALQEAMSNATGKPVKGRDRVAPTETDQQEARSWLLNPSISLAVACDVTGVDILALIGWAKARAATNWRVQ